MFPAPGFDSGSVGLRRAAISLMRVEDLEPEEGLCFGASDSQSGGLNGNHR